MRARLLALSEEHQAPLYVFDGAQAGENLNFFKGLFKHEIFYAVKSNPYHQLLKTFVDAGVGLDVSSELELKRALAAGSSKIVATGPGKSDSFLDLLLQHRAKIFLQLDSIQELKTVSQKAKALGIKIDCGVRIIVDPQSTWNKFGVPFEELGEFFSDSNVNIVGFHSHQSFNSSEKPYIDFLAKLCDWSGQKLNASQREAVRWIDIGGGLVPPYFEGVYSWNKSCRMLFDTSKIVPKILADEYKPRYVCERYTRLERILTKISKNWGKSVLPKFPNAKLFIEPGRALSYPAMHILLRVADKKAKQAVILNGGGNMIGYERYQYMAYVPTFNLTRFSETQEQPMILYGALCTPEDIWGYYYYGTGIEKGDVILMPFQGDYTYTCAQPNFIFPIPEVVEL
jgi:diaminopimelate decarboxylase